MNQIIIIYEFQNENTEKVISFKKMIREYGSYAFITQNSCMIWTTATVVNVRDYLISGMNIGDKLFVSIVSAPAAWSGGINQEVANYIIKNLKSK
jgi:hypothetical protein